MVLIGMWGRRMGEEIGLDEREDGRKLTRRCSFGCWDQ